MTILNIVTEFAGQVGVIPRIVKLDCDDSFSEITADNYLVSAIKTGYTFYQSDIVAVTYDVSGTPTSQFFTVSITSSSINLNPLNESLTYPLVDSYSVSSATPGTVRTILGKITNTATTMTSGNIVGVRGEVDLVGASGGFLYGVQGKIIPTGTLSGSVWAAPVFAQFDISAATITNGQLAPVWADYGTTATAGTYTGARMYAGTNTTAAILNSQIYLYGGATNLFELVDNNGLVGATYITTPAGTTPSGTVRTLNIVANGIALKILAAATYS